jgi:hypothetical protein
MLNVAATVVYRRGRVSSDGAAHSGSIKPRRPFQSGTVRVASANLAPTGVIWHLFRKRVSQAGERSEWPVTHPQSPDRGLFPVSPSSDHNRAVGPCQIPYKQNATRWSSRVCLLRLSGLQIVIGLADLREHLAQLNSTFVITIGQEG